VATMYMIFSLIIAALPVGVIGGNFSQVWNEVAIEKRVASEELKEDQKFITAAIQRIDPFEMSKLMYVEVWNARFPDQAKLDGVQSDVNVPSRMKRPDVAEFIGRANFVLRLDPSHPVAGVTQTLKLQDGAEGGLPKRTVTGSITVQYDWAPGDYQSLLGQADASAAGSATFALVDTTGSHDGDARPNGESLHGKLKVTVMHAEGLINSSYQCGKLAHSNPYCKVFCYPRSANGKGPLVPACWRSPVQVGTCSPRWFAHSVFDFCWTPPQPEDLQEEDVPVEGPPLSSIQEPTKLRSEGTFAGPTLMKRAQVSGLVRTLGQELNALREEVRTLKSRVHLFSLTPERPAERMN